MPSLACAAASALRRPAAPAAPAGDAAHRDCSPSRDPRAGLRAPAAARPAPAGERAKRGAPLRVDAREAVYLLNPSGDLPATQAAFEPWFRRQPGWQARARPWRHACAFEKKKMSKALLFWGGVLTSAMHGGTEV
jgi:hypothetical protein